MKTLRSLLACLLCGLYCMPVQAAEVQKVESSGLSALLIQETSVPAFNLQISFKRSGTAYQPESKLGLANLAGTLMNEGAGDYNAQAFQGELEKNAIRLYGSADSDLFTLSLQSLSEKREKAMELLLLALTRPRFDEEAIGRMRDAVLSDLARLEGRSSYLSARAWWKAAYPNHPYGREGRGTPDTLRAITRADLKTFVQQRFARDTIMIAAAGDISPEDLKKLLDEIARHLPEKASGEVAVATVAPASGAPIYIASDVPQSVVTFGIPGIARKDARFYTAYVLNYILGGGELSSRLMDVLRQERGLIYSVSTDLVTLEHSAVLSGMLASSNETVEEAIAQMREQLRLIGEKGVSAHELEVAKAYLTGAFPLNMDSNNQLVAYLMSIQLYDLGLDFFHTRNNQINAVKLEDVNALAKTVFSHEPLITVAGKRVEKPGRE